VPDSVPHSQGKVVYVWFPDALLNYASAPGYKSADPERSAFFEEVWPPDLHLMSKDIFTRFHTTLWPALLQAQGLELPRQCFAHGFWTVDGRKMSKRDPESIVEPTVFARQISQASGCDFKIAVDALRYYCLREVTFGSDGDFSRQGCVQKYNSDLANGLGNLLNRALSMLRQYFQGVVPAPGPGMGLKSRAEELLPRVAAAYESLAFHEALTLVWELVSDANRLIEEQKPWARAREGRLDEVGHLIAELLCACQWCAVCLWPVMPSASGKMASLLNIEQHFAHGEAFPGPRWAGAADWNHISQGHQCREPEPLFPRASFADGEPGASDKRNSNPNVGKASHNKAEKKMDFQINNAPGDQAMDPANQNLDAPVASGQATGQAAAENSHTAEESIDSVQHIAYEDFAKVDLRVGKVIEAEKVPKADKLLRLQVDMGDHSRQILAGIAQHFEPEALIGKSVLVVANLAPRKLRGFESQGMILAASLPDGPPLSLVSVDESVPAGATVK